MSAENTQMSSDEAVLEETFLLATNPSNADELAVSMFCGLIHSKEKLVGKAIELLLSKIKSQDVAQSLRALTILEECMSEAGPEFQAKVSKFRFLNELTYLVSKRHKGNLTPQKIKDKILDCFLLWTTQYPDKEKIKEAYDKLCSEGINHTPSSMPSTAAAKRSIFLDDESEKKFGELLRSKNKEDLKKANLLIQYHVNQDIKRSERIQRQKDKLEEANETVDILDEVLNRLATDNDVNTEEKSLAKELVTSCKKLKTEIEMITRIIEDSQEDLLCDAIKVSERLLNVIEKYNYIKSHKRPQKRDVTPTVSQTKIDDLLSDFTDMAAQSTSQEPQAATMDDLNDIFSQIPEENPTNLNIFPQGEILAPVQVHNKGDEKPSNMEASVNNCSLENNSNIKTSLHVIDKISEELFKENLKDKERISTFKKEPIKIPLNALIKIEKTISPEKDEDSNTELKETINDAKSQIIDSILNETNATEFPVNDLMLGDKPNYIDELKELTVNDTNKKSTMEINTIIEDIVSKVENVIKLQPDDEENKVDIQLPTENIVNSPTKENEKCIKRHFKHLSDIHVELKSIQPSMEPPRKLMDDIQSLRITLQFALDRPSSNVLVIVISTVNQSYLPMEDYHFDASVPKPCKIRLLEPTGYSLPGVKAFSFPTDDLKQILLLFNPTEKPVDITCIISYKLGDDPDPIKESIVAESIPFVE